MRFSVPRLRAVLVLAAAIASGGCMNHYVLHPEADPPGVRSWSQTTRVGDVQLALEWAAPRGDGPYPGVLVHPAGGRTAEDLQGVVRGFADAGYIAVAADYKRFIDGKPRRSMYPWHTLEEMRASVTTLLDDPRTDRDRIAAVGYSQGGIFSLLIAAQAPEIRAIVAYYPVTDFNTWFAANEGRGIRKLIMRGFLRQIKKSSGAETDEELAAVLDRASPMTYVDQLTSPILLVHGALDTSAPPEESERLAARLRELGRDVEVEILPTAGHVFNFKDEALAREAWATTLDFLERKLGS